MPDPATAAPDGAAHAGGCLCGAVRFRVEGPLAPIQVCHCGQCRKAHGGPFAAVIPVETARLAWLAGAGHLQAFASSPGKERVFCRRCGSPVLSRRPALPGVVRVRAGLFDGPLGVPIGLHQHTAAACDWWPLEDDGAPRFAGAPSDAPPAGDERP
jgi:hypothetical protein